MIHGGHHERSLRAGTENVPGAVATRPRGAVDRRSSGRTSGHARPRCATAWSRVCSTAFPTSHVNGAGAPRTPNTTNIRFDGIEGEALLIALDLRASRFPAARPVRAARPSLARSHAIGLTREQARSSLRFSLGRSNNVEQVDALIDAVAECVAPSAQDLRPPMPESRPSPSPCRAEWTAPSSRACCMREAKRVVGLTMQLWNQRRLPELAPDGGPPAAAARSTTSTTPATSPSTWASRTTWSTSSSASKSRW